MPARPERRTSALREWIAPPAVPGSRLWGWLGPLAVTAFAAVLRFYRLGLPRAVIFDETYYVKDAGSLLRWGYERNFSSNSDKLLLQHPPNLKGVWLNTPEFIAHPPDGKWAIAIGEWIFGMTPFGWRFSCALFGTLAVLMLARIARRMTHSTLLGCMAGFLLACDGMELVLSRTGILDIFVMFWAIAAFGCLVIDRDKARARLATKLAGGGNDDYGPFVLHGWRIAAGVCLGLMFATKWTGLYYMAGFGLMVLFWDYGARRAAGLPRAALGVLIHEVGPAFISMAVVPFVVYVLSWWGWIFNPGGYNRGHVASNPIVAFFQAMPRLWQYNQQMWDFHTNLTAKHPYQSWPWNWLILYRPVAFYYCGTGQKGCPSMPANSSSEVLDIGTPAIWWFSIIALIVLIVWWLTHRDWRAGSILCGFMSGWLPWFWFGFHHRTMFLFYTSPMLPFMVLAIVMVMGLVIGKQTATPTRRVVGAAAAGAYVLIVLVNFWWLFPVLTGEIIPYSSWYARMWFPHWI